MISSWCMLLEFRHDLKEKRGQNPCRGAFTPATPLPHTLLPHGLPLAGSGFRQIYVFAIVFVL
jgi:hypothetical protein